MTSATTIPPVQNHACGNSKRYQRLQLKLSIDLYPLRDIFLLAYPEGLLVRNSCFLIYA